MVKCLNIGKNIGKPIYRSISSPYSLFYCMVSVPVKARPTRRPDQLLTTNNYATSSGTFTHFKSLLFSTKEVSSTSAGGNALLIREVYGVEPD